MLTPGVNRVMVQAQHPCEAPLPILELPQVNKPRERTRGGASLIEPMDPDLHGPIALDRVNLQAARNDGARDAARRWAGCGELTSVLPNLLPCGEASLIVIELDIVGKDGICLGGIARRE